MKAGVDVGRLLDLVRAAEEAHPVDFESELKPVRSALQTIATWLEDHDEQLRALDLLCEDMPVSAEKALAGAVDAGAMETEADAEEVSYTLDDLEALANSAHNVSADFPTKR